MFWTPACAGVTSLGLFTTPSLYDTAYITGWRIGYLIANADWAAAAGQINGLIYVCPPSPLQAGVAAGIAQIPDTYYQNTQVSYTKKRDMICSALDRAGLTPHIPEGSYYVLADTTRVPGKTAREKAMHILDKTSVASVPGTAFYETGGDNLVRFCFAKNDALLETACERITKAGRFF